MRRAILCSFLLLLLPPLPLLAQEEDVDDTDFCLEEGWYGDGECDFDCPKPDPDCRPGGAEEEDLEDLYDEDVDLCDLRGLYDDGECTPDCPQPDPDCTLAEDFCELDGWYGDGVCDEDCPKPDPDCASGSGSVSAASSVVAPCPAYAPVRCQDGSCRLAEKDCFPADLPLSVLPGVSACPPEHPVQCLDGSCVWDVSQCAGGKQQISSSASSARAVVAPVPRGASASSAMQGSDVPSVTEDSASVIPSPIAEDAERAEEGVPSPSVTREDLQSLARSLLSEDTAIVRIGVDQGVIEVDYRLRARLAGFLPLSYTLALRATDQGAQGSGPWWLFLASDDREEATLAVQTALAEAHDVHTAPANTFQQAHTVLSTVARALRIHREGV
ncbi:hypothetical protein COU80_03875 [Candidatus Peregrinibacteria bacterium CG10_big_fil_rev_8_21_14_0_10_55_24]|nr:MAG: hypothetical protein COU80_03875 [Candidatus Peregrinibacteria bacterium CG10_big_fil_rev_8_21_14_0_10_55_24]